MTSLCQLPPKKIELKQKRTEFPKYSSWNPQWNWRSLE
jgi:hypothetical protein